VIPLADLVITHGGNNTTTECLHFGKPMIALPLFWDQYDNAQRVDELGLGVRLDTYSFSDTELRSAIGRLLADRGLAGRLARGAAQIQSRRGLRLAAGLIEQAAREA
jgi:UDP:flavonoid glycosyltransferase YjiC (YdhE family)